jgi:hypothetical protein
MMTNLFLNFAARVESEALVLGVLADFVGVQHARDHVEVQVLRATRLHDFLEDPAHVGLR